VDDVLIAASAVFFVFHATRLLLLVLGGRVIAFFARRAFQRDDVSHDASPKE